jgi:hypothetical protein
VSRLEQAGLPQGSPLSPILNGGAVAFVDDYTAWAVGKIAAENEDRLQAIVQQAKEWESRSGASFEGEKMALIHCTRNSRQYADESIIVKGQEALVLQQLLPKEPCLDPPIPHH